MPVLSARHAAAQSWVALLAWAVVGHSSARPKAHPFQQQSKCAAGKGGRMGRVLSARQMRRQTQTLNDQKYCQWMRTAATMTKRCASPKRPQGRPPAGAVLIDGKWHATEQSIEIAAKRVLRNRERERIRREATREMLRRERPELFAHEPAEPPKPAPSQTLQSTLLQYRKKD